MARNIGYSDRIFRVIGAIILALLFFTGVLTGVVGIISVIIAAILLATSLISYCPIYGLCKISTRRKSAI